MKITRTKKITASSVDKRLSFTSTKYKGYRISLDHRNSCYNIYDKHGELEDSGFTSQLAAKEAIDRLVKDSDVTSSKKITAGSMPYVKWVKKAEDGSWVMWGGSNSPDIDPDFLDRINHPNYPNPEYNIENQYTDYTVLPAGQSPEDVTSSKKITAYEDVEYLDNQETLKELIDELASSGVDIYDAQDILQALGADYGYDRDDQFAILEDIQEYVGKGINSAEEIDEDELETTEQEFTSKDTSINSSKLPAIYKLVNFPKGSVVLDFGGGRYDNGVEYLNSIGCEGYVYDPYNRTSEHNAAVVKAIRSNGGADIVLNSNVLNVIKEAAARRTVLKNIKKLVKPSGKIYITVYEGNGSGEGKQSKKDSFQLNRKTADYLEEIQEVFPDATRKGKLIVATPNGASVKSSINASEDVEIDYYKLEEIANRYNTSKPVSGDWYKETEHELRAIASELGLSMKQAKQVMIDELGFEEDQFADIPINASEDTLTGRIFDFLDECGGYTDYNQKIEDVSEEFGMSPDEAEGYVCSWIQNEDAMWHDTADQYEDRDIEESCKVEASYRTRHKNYCPHCTNRTLIEVEDGYYVCDECGAEYKGEPSFEGGLILEDIEESCKVEASISPSRAKEIVGTLERRLKKKVSQVMQSEEFGFPADEVDNYSVVEVEYQPDENRIKCEVRAELTFDSLMELAEELNPIVEKYNEWAYFDAVTSGIIESYIPLNDVYSSTSTSTDKKAVTAAYSEPEDLVREYEIVFDTTATVTEDSFEIDDTEEFNEIYDDEYNILVESDSDSIVENLQDLIEMNMPDEPGKYRISGIAHMKYFIDNLYREYEGPSDPDDALGSTWLNSEAADITYDPRSSYVEAFQVEKI